MGVREVLIHRHVLAWNGDDCGELDLGAESWSTWSRWTDFPVIVHVAEAWLVSGEGRAVRVWMCSAIDDVGSIAVQGVWGVEGVFEVAGFAGLASREGGSFEARWKIGEGSVTVEIAEEPIFQFIPHIFSIL